jgi:hypothetical protein
MNQVLIRTTMRVTRAARKRTLLNRRLRKDHATFGTGPAEFQTPALRRRSTSLPCFSPHAGHDFSVLLFVCAAKSLWLTETLIPCGCEIAVRVALFKKAEADYGSEFHKRKPPDLVKKPGGFEPSPGGRARLGERTEYTGLSALYLLISHCCFCCPGTTTQSSGERQSHGQPFPRALRARLSVRECAPSGRFIYAT